MRRLYRRQEGQSIVEFALVFPLFLMFVFGIIFFGVLFYDYIALSNVARDSAREASIKGTDSYEDIIADYGNGGSKQIHLYNGIYTWDPEADFSIESGEQVTVRLETHLDMSNSVISFLNKYMRIDFSDNVKSPVIKYQMYNESSGS